MHKKSSNVKERPTDIKTIVKVFLWMCSEELAPFSLAQALINEDVSLKSSMTLVHLITPFEKCVQDVLLTIQYIIGRSIFVFAFEGNK